MLRMPIINDDLDEASETFTVRVSAAGELPAGFMLGNATTTVTIADDDESPVLEEIENVTLLAGQSVDIAASATDGDGDDITYAWTRQARETIPAMPDGTLLNQARLRFTPTQAGTYTMTVTASDEHGNSDTEQVVITVNKKATVSVPLTLTVTEAAGSAVVTVTTSVGFGRSLTFAVSYGDSSDSAGGPDSGGDYGDAVSKLTFSGSDLTRTISIPITDDDVDEEDETFTVKLSLTEGDSLPDNFRLGNMTTTVTVKDDDMAGVTVSESDLTMAEGGEGSYTVVLTSEPTASVTVSVSGATGDVSVSGVPLTFSVSNWNEEQTVTVSADEDLDAVRDADVTLTHAATGGGYGAVSIGSVKVSVTENDTAGVTVSESDMTVVEGGEGSYTVVLTSEPTGSVTVSVSGATGDVSVSGAPLTFSVSNWNEEQTVTVSADEDLDAVRDADVTLTHAATGGGYGAVSIGSVKVSVTENDTAGVTVSPGSVEVTEGSSAEYTVVLTSEPTGSVTVSVSGATGDVSVSGAPLTFSVSNWNEEQTVTVSADEDLDAVRDADVTLTHAATGGGYGAVSIGSVKVSVTENDTAGVTVSESDLTVVEGGEGSYTVVLTSEPTASVTVSVSGATGDVSVSGAPLTFSVSNWNEEQTVTVSADEDLDAVRDADVTLTHAATGGGYGAVSIGSVKVSVTENDTAGVTVSPGSVDVTEGGSAEYTVVLTSEPTASVTVSVSGATGDVSVSGAPLTFSVSNWNEEQTVTVSADEDLDAVRDADVTLTHAATGGGYGAVSIGTVKVSVTENDTCRCDGVGVGLDGS